MTPEKATTQLKKASKQCVKCGLCLPHCPTYKLFNIEPESPRGRISLMQGYCGDMLEFSDKLEERLEHCLSCRACEAACPAQVEYGMMIDTAKFLLNQDSKTPFFQRILKRAGTGLLTGPKYTLALTRQLVNIYQSSYLRKLTQKTKILNIFNLDKSEKILPSFQQKAVSIPNLKHDSPPKVSLFSGCIAEIVDTPTLQATVDVLSAYGFQVDIPKQQGCCGAISSHNGDIDGADKCKYKNIDAFGEADTPIVYVATGCGAHLQEYLPDEEDANSTSKFTSRVQEICAFLTKCKLPNNVRINPLPEKVALHIPCSQRNILKDLDSTKEILGMIPELDIIDIPSNDTCCGAAGTYMLNHPDIASELLQIKLDDISNIQPNIVASSNIGCALHMQAGLAGHGSTIKVKHPIEILAQQIEYIES